MLISNNIRRLNVSAAPLALAVAMISSPGYAQDAAGQIPAEELQTAAQEAVDQEGGEEIVVTGTLIRNPNLVASSPVTVVGQEEIQLSQSNNAEELLRELPGAAANIGSAVNNGNAGASYVDLRGPRCVPQPRSPRWNSHCSIRHRGSCRS